VETQRGVTICRACGLQGLVSVLDLGTQPLSNQLLPTVDAPCPEYPLHLRICPHCALGQVGEVVAPSAIFSDYPYLSSVSTSWVEHMRSYAVAQSAQLGRQESDYVLEIASNDAYLLRSFLDLGHSVLGVEPAENVAQVARSAGVPTIAEFFGRGLAQRISEDHGYPQLVVANNVLAHVPDLDDFVGGLADVSGPDTRISVENPSLLQLFDEAQFDTVYHEHYSYLSVYAVRRLALRHGLELYDVEQLPTHGGSYRYWLGRRGQFPISDRVEATERMEVAGGLCSPETWQRFSMRSVGILDALREWLAALHTQNVAAYGAAAKGNTLLNAVGEPARVLAGVFDGSPEKVGRYMPGSRLPIWDRSSVAAGDWSDLLILPWNLSAEIGQQLRRVDADMRLWRAIPELERVGA
jgi:hypothetical protein